MSHDADITWRIIAESFVSGLSAEWLSRMPEGMIFELSMPNDERGGKSKLRIEHIVETDTDAMVSATDWNDILRDADAKLDHVDDRTPKDLGLPRGTWRKSTALIQEEAAYTAEPARIPQPHNPDKPEP